MEWQERRVKNGRVMRGEGVRNCKGEGALDSNSQQTVKRPSKILFYIMKRKESRARTVREEEGEEEIVREGARPLFKGIINSLSALVSDLSVIGLIWSVYILSTVSCHLFPVNYFRSTT